MQVIQGSASRLVGFIICWRVIGAGADMTVIAPAILVYSKEELKQRLASVPSAKTIHIDIMDGKFVNNTTIGPAELQDLPKDREIEYHLMVADPLAFIEKLPGGKNSIFEVHLESVKAGQEKEIAEAVKKKKSRLAWVLNPPTPLARLESCLGSVSQILLMTVNPGWAGQSYIEEVEEKMRELRKLRPGLSIEIDGGVGAKTIPRARAAGADRFAAASSVFGHKEPDTAYRNLLSLANKRGE